MKNIPTHLQSVKAIIKKREQKLRRKGEYNYLGGMGGTITVKQMEFCKEVVYGNVNRTVNDWAEFVGVSVKLIKIWERKPVIKEYMEYLKVMRQNKKGV